MPKKEKKAAKKEKAKGKAKKDDDDDLDKALAELSLKYVMAVQPFVSPLTTTSGIRHWVA